MDGAFEVLTATNNTVKAIAATQQQHGRHLTKLQTGVDLTVSRLSEATERLDTLEINQIRTNDTLREHSDRFDQLDAKFGSLDTKVDGLAGTVQDHGSKLDTILSLLQPDRPTS
jgi:predicted nuclease with TOPRIM domain